MPRTRVSVDKIVATQRNVDESKVDAIAAKDPSEIDTDPIVHPMGGRYFLSDGHHRWLAAIKRGDKTIPVRRVK